MYLIRNKKFIEKKEKNDIINWFICNKSILDNIFNELIKIAINNNIKIKYNLNKFYNNFILFAYKFS